MQIFQGYRAKLEGKEPIVVQSFFVHLLRYRLAHLCFGALLIIGGGVVLFQYLTPQRLQQEVRTLVTISDELTPEGLQLTYDPLSGLSSASSGALIWSLREVMTTIAQYYPIPAPGVMTSPSNLLVIDPEATVEDVYIYDTLVLMTREHLIRNINNSLQVDSWSSFDISEPGIVDRSLVMTFAQQADLYMQENAGRLRWMIVGVSMGIGLLLLPFLAGLMTIWTTLIMLVITLLGRALSRLWVRTSYRYLFTGLSWLYLPIYFLQKILERSGILTSALLVTYLLMVGCLAILIVRLEEGNVEDSVA